MKRPDSNKGMTLIEAVTSITVLAIALPPLVALFTEVAASTPDETFQRAALNYADALMEEIVSKAFEDPQLAAGSFGAEESTRANFDDIDDYDALTEVSLEHVDGTALDAYGGFERSARIENVLSNDPSAAAAEPDGSTPLKRITVRVAWTGARGGELTLVTLRSNLAALELGEPLDGAGSSGSALNTKGDEFELILVNTTGVRFEIDSFELTANRPTPELREFQLATQIGDWQDIWRGRESLPTGNLALNEGDPEERRIPANGAAGARFKFRDDLSTGPIVFTLRLHYLNGTTSSLVISMEWMP